jgi:hypothetical protein
MNLMAPQLARNAEKNEKHKEEIAMRNKSENYKKYAKIQQKEDDRRRGGKSKRVKSKRNKRTKRRNARK